MNHKLSLKFQNLILTFLFFSSVVSAFGADTTSQDDYKSQLKSQYEAHCWRSSDINEHIPVLCKLANECSSVVEIGVRSIVSTWGLLQGLAENQLPEKSYLGIDLVNPSINSLNLARQLAEGNGIKFTFWCVNDMQIQLEPVDLLFIDSLHTYCHLTYELETFSPNVRKFICMHDTSDPWGNRDDSEYHGNYSEYPSSYDRTKRGLWPAVADFLERHPEWSLYERRYNNHGFTILKRNSEETLIKPVYHPDVEIFLKNKIILCTGQYFLQEDRLKETIETDMKFIPYKKIFVATKDPKTMSLSFENQKPHFELIKGRGKQLDNINFIIATMKNAVNDPDVYDDDIILFKRGSLQVTGIASIRQHISKLLEGYDMVVGSWNAPAGRLVGTDVFFVRVSAIREIVKDLPLVTKLSSSEKNSETYFINHILNPISKVYEVPSPRISEGFNELGFYGLVSR